MIKVVVKNKAGESTHTADFETQQLADQWVNENISLKSFGKNERWVSEIDLGALGEDALSATDFLITGGPDEEHKVYRFPAEYSVSFIDITDELAAKRQQKQAIQLAQKSAGQRLSLFPNQIDACSDLESLKLVMKNLVNDIVTILNR
jgi:hypothetical protein